MHSRVYLSLPQAGAGCSWYLSSSLKRLSKLSRLCSPGGMFRRLVSGPQPPTSHLLDMGLRQVPADRCLDNGLGTRYSSKLIVAQASAAQRNC